MTLHRVLNVPELSQKLDVNSKVAGSCHMNARCQGL